jgi:hypothetical protein
MDFISILATIILFTTVATLAVALAAYAAFKLRERRKPTKAAGTNAAGQIEPMFLERYMPDTDDIEEVAPEAAR